MKNQRGFTIIEIIIVIAILAILSTIAIILMPQVRTTAELNNTQQELTSVLKLAQSKANNAEGNSAWGVKIDTTVSPIKYTLFKGSSFASRDTSFDQIFYLPKDINATLYSNASFNSNNGEIVFKLGSGEVTIAGGALGWGITLTSSSMSSSSNQRDVSVLATGVFPNETASPFVRITNYGTVIVKDSKHVHFTYTRVFNQSTESITLDYNNGEVVHSFPISAYLRSGQIYIEDSATVGGSLQKVVVLTHSIAASSTFSVYRDLRFNNQPLKITMSGDPGILLQYNATGSSVTENSTYVNTSTISWQ